MMLYELGQTVTTNKGITGIITDINTENKIYWIENAEDFWSVKESDIVKNITVTKSSIIEGAISKIQAKLNIKLPLILEVTKKEMIAQWGRAYTGIYSYLDSKIQMQKEAYQEKNVIHEIGHYIHDKYLNNKKYKFGTEGKTDYAKKDHIENFAECFTQWIYCQNLKGAYKRVQQMDIILKDLRC